jgi:hypothetical protein
MNKRQLLSDGELHSAVPLESNMVNREEFGDGHPLLELGSPDNE